MYKSKAVFLLALACLLSSCVTHHITGHYIKEAEIKKLQAMSSPSRAQVLSMFGSPTLNPAYSQDTWYYIGQTLAHRPGFKPKVQDQQIIKISFAGDKVNEILVERKNTSRTLSISPSVTNSPATNKSNLELFLYNFSKTKKKRNKDR